MPFARSARVIASRMTGPRRLPTWTVPDGVFESLTTCGPASRTRTREFVGPIHGVRRLPQLMLVIL